MCGAGMAGMILFWIILLAVLVGAGILIYRAVIRR